jgi:hypothetical protein
MILDLEGKAWKALKLLKLSKSSNKPFRRNMECMKQI